MDYSFEQLVALWRQAGGPTRQARVMAAIALAESGGDPNAVNRDADGTVDRGLWQINSSHGYPARASLVPLQNAREAVAVFHSQGLTAWSTYVSGAYRRFMAGSHHRTRPRWGVFTRGNFDGTDQGVDFRGAGAIPALDTGTVTDIGSVSIIEGGRYPYVIYRLQAGPYKGRYVYTMETFTPRVRRGQHLRMGQAIGHATGGGVGIETGFNRDAEGINPVAPLGPDPHASTPPGEDMWTYIQGLISGSPTIGPSLPGAPAPPVNPAGGLPQPSRDHGASLAAADVGGTLVDDWAGGFGGGGVLGFLGDITGIGEVVDFLKAALWLVNPMNWLRLFEALVGAVFLFLSLLGLGVILASRSEVVQEAAGVAQRAPGPVGAAGTAVTRVTRRRRRASSSAPRTAQANAERARGQAELATARVATERERRNEVRARRRRNLEQARSSRAERERIRDRAYRAGLTDIADAREAGFRP